MAAASAVLAAVSAARATISWSCSEGLFTAPALAEFANIAAATTPTHATSERIREREKFESAIPVPRFPRFTRLIASGNPALGC